MALMMPARALPRSIRAALLVLAAAVSMPPAAGQASARPQAITVVMDDNYPPYVMREPDGTLRGILVDQWSLWEQKTGVQVTLVGMDWGKAQRFMAEGKADVIDTIFYTEERAKLYEFSKPWTSIRVPIFFHRDIGGIGDARSLRGFTVGVKEGDAAVEFLLSQGVEDLAQYPSYEAIVRAAADRAIRVFCVDEPPALYYLYKMHLEADFRSTDPLYVGQFHRAVHKGRKDLLRFVEEGFARISARELRQIDRKWLGTPLLLRPEHYRYLIAAAVAVALAALSLVAWNATLRAQVASRTAQLRQTVEALRESEARFRILAENANDVIWTMDRNLRFTYVSPSVLQLRGFTPEEVLAQSLEEAVSPGSLAMVKRKIEELEEQIDRGVRSFSLRPVEVEQPRKDGSTVWTEVVVTPLFDDSGGFQYVLGVSRDITERKRQEEERRALEAQMLQVQKLESLGVMAGGIAHDFNNILTSILGNAQLAAATLHEGSGAWDHLVAIEEASRRAAELCRLMLAYAGRASMAKETVDLSSLVEEMLPMLQMSISKKAELRCSLPQDLPAVDADPAQLRQVVMNLVINASEALGDSPGEISVSTGAVECSAGELGDGFPSEPRPPGCYAYIEVSDTGCGMDPATMRRIYDPFFTTKFAGRGLGLAAVAGIVRGHGGLIKVASEPGRGSTFRVLLPASPRVRREPIQRKSSTAAWRGSGTVLLVDDEPAVLGVGRLMLQRLGFHVLTAADGLEAVRLFREHHGEITCTILDLTMPGLDGRQALEELRAVDPTARVAVASGYTEQDVLARFAGVPGVGFVQKPYRLNDLERVLRALLQAGPREAE